MSALFSKFSTGHNSSGRSAEQRLKSIENFLVNHTSELEFLLSNLSLNNFNQTEAQKINDRIDEKVKSVSEVFKDKGYASFSNGICIAYGNVSITPTEANTATYVNVNYPCKFKTPPAIAVTPYTALPDKVLATYAERSNYNFKLVLKRHDTTPTTVSWIAIGRKECISNVNK